MHLCSGVYDHGQLFGLITCSEHREFLSNYIPSRSWRVPQASPLCQSREIRLETTHLSRLQPKLSHFPNSHCCSQRTERPGGVASDDDEGAGVIAACAETASEHDFAQCGGFVIFPHFLHRSLSLFAFLPLPLDLSDPLCENLHLSPRAQVPLA